MSVTVYSKPKCMQCKYTKRFLDNAGIEYTSINVFEDAEALEQLKKEGLRTLPVIKVEGWEPFMGYQPDKLEKLKEI